MTNSPSQGELVSPSLTTAVLDFMKSLIIAIKFVCSTFIFSFCMRPFLHAESNALVTSRITTAVFLPLLSHNKSTACTALCPCLYANWFLGTPFTYPSSFFILDIITSSRIFPQFDSILIGRYSFCVAAVVVLGIGTITALFHLTGK